jgi:hypothetical protein
MELYNMYLPERLPSCNPEVLNKKIIFYSNMKSCNSNTGSALKPMSMNTGVKRHIKHTY